MLTSVAQWTQGLRDKLKEKIEGTLPELQTSFDAQAQSLCEIGDTKKGLHEELDLRIR
jgi:hypothetical protein